MGRLLVISSLLLTCACSDDSGDDGASGSVTCAAGEFAIEGSLEGEGVSHRGQLSRYAWSQLGEGTLDASFDGGGEFHAAWQELIGDGQTFTAAGHVTLPTTGPYAGQTLDYPAGTLTKLDGGVTFEVSGFQLAVQCVAAPCPSEAVEGTLQGCIEPRRP